jgi:hypothetical protein
MPIEPACPPLSFIELLAAEEGRPICAGTHLRAYGDEAAWLHAFRSLSAEDRPALLAYALSRARRNEN